MVVPALLAAGETPDDILTSRGYSDLDRLLEALRARDTRIVETLLETQVPSLNTPLSEAPGHRRFLISSWAGVWSRLHVRIREEPRRHRSAEELRTGPRTTSYGTPRPALHWGGGVLPEHRRCGRAGRLGVAEREWPTVFLLPAYSPDLNPVEDVWAHIEHSLANLAVMALDRLETLSVTG